MKQSTRRLLTLFLSVAFLVGAFVTYSSFVKPAYEEINTLRGTLAAKTDLYASQEKILTDIQELLDRYKGATKIQETVSLALPNEANEHLAFYQMLGLVRIANLSLESLGVSGAAPLQLGTSGGAASSILPKVGSVQLNLGAKGGYEDFKKLLQLIETNIRVMDLISLNVSPPDPERQREGGPPTFTFNLAVKAYYQSPE